MSADEPRARKIRRRKAPTVREAIEQSTKVADKPKRKLRVKLPRLGIVGRFFALIWGLLAPLRKVLSWLTPRYFVNSWREVRQVEWPNRRETWRLTVAVFIFAIVFGALVAGVDKGIDEIFKKVVLR